MENNLIPFGVEYLTKQSDWTQGLDDLYETVDFRTIFEEKNKQADNLLSKVSGIVGAGALAEHIKAGTTPQGTRWVVQMTDEMQAAIDAGVLKLDTDKAGRIFAQTRNGNLFGQKLPITQEIITAGINPLEVSQALQMKAIQDQLDKMMGVLEEINGDVKEVIQGQMNDRLGLYNSGLNLYLEARNIGEDQFRMLVAAQAVKSLSDAIEQMVLSIHSDIEYLLQGKYKQKKGKSTEEIRERMNSINKCFDVVHKAYMLRAAIYYERNEVQAMLSVLDEYGRFLQREIVPNAPVLSELDGSDKLLTGGRWEHRSGAFHEISNVRRQLQKSNVYYLNSGGVTNAAEG